jgi:GH35 family endo-1,4-beta-xylanase
MKRLHILFIIIFFSLNNLLAQKSPVISQKVRFGSSAETNDVMSQAYWDIWNSEVQARIDNDIEKYRKADAILKFEELPAGSEVKVEQVSHDFIFGAHIFNFNQLGTIERNQKYKDLYGTLFNSATIAFYWKPFEMQPGRLRFREEYWDTEEYWNQVEEPEKKPHWRRPATDPVVEFCESKGIRLHGHPITWSAPRFHPEWLFEQFCPANEKEKIDQLGHEGLRDLTNAQIEELIPVYTKEINRLFRKRIVDLAGYYKGRIHSWDVVNESRSDFNFHKTSLTGDGICLAQRGKINLMPGDYTYHSFKLAENVFPNNVLLNINDNVLQDTNAYNAYINQIKDLVSHGCRIDIMGSQMHLFNPHQCLDIAEGKPIETPEIVWNKMETLSKAGLPIHLSEITITSPGDDERGREIQAIITRNLYRLWFSIEKMMGITWWNVVDGCGEPGEPTISGLFTRDMDPKPSFYVLNQLINEEWKTNLVLKVNEDGTATFRGFKGEYVVSWKDKNGNVQQSEFYLKKDGDGFQTFP